VPFLALISSSGAGSGKRTQKPLGAHQENGTGELFRSQMKGNTAVPIYNQITFPVLEIQHQLDPLFTSMHCFIIRVISLLSFINLLLCFTKQE
jgi:hypothetical protein